MTRQKLPTPLDHFVPVDFKVLQHVMDKGQITINFATDSQACSTRSHLMRLVFSLKMLKPDDPLSIASQSFIFKWRVKSSLLTITNRQTSKETDAMEAALRGEVEAVSSDPMEFERPSDEALEAYIKERLKEQGNDEAGKGSSGDDHS
jgi:hypothetical protein